MDDRNPGTDHGPPDPTGPPDGYHAVPEGYGNAVLYDEDGNPISREEWERMIAEADEREPRYVSPDGYFNFPEGRGQVVFLDEDGNPMTPEEFDAYVEHKRKDRRRPGTEPHEQ